MTAKGFSEVRTVRVLGAGLLIFGATLLALGVALSYVDGFASELVEKALARYGNLTGKFALNNFSEDKQLMAQILAVRDGLLPAVSSAVPFAFALGGILFLGGACALVFPHLFGAGLLRLHIFKRVGEEGEPFQIVEWVGAHKKAFSVAAGALILILFLGILMARCSDPARETPDKVAELEREASRFCHLQQSYFAAHKSLGTWEQTGYEAPESDDFLYEKAGRFALRIKNAEPWENCPDSSAWKVSFDVTGFFAKELKVYTNRPDNPACETLTPEFRKHVLSGK